MNKECPSKHLIPFLFLFLVGLIPARADTIPVLSNQKFYFSISYGAAIPAGSFSTYWEPISRPVFLYDRTLTSEAAKVGFAGKVEVSYFFYQRLGVASLFYLSQNAGEPYSAADFYSGHRGGLGVGISGSSTTYSIKTWNTFGALTGLILKLNSDPVVFNIKLMGGFQQVKSPEARIVEKGSVYFGSGSYDYVIDRIQPVMISENFVFNFGVNVRFRLQEGFGIQIGTDVFNSDPSFKGTALQDYNDGSGQRLTKFPISFTKNIPFICVNLGVSYAIK